MADTGINTIMLEDRYGISSDERCWITVIKNLKKQYPDAVTIVRNPEDNDGCIVASFPKTWLKITPPRHMNLTDEQRMELAERLRKSRTAKESSGTTAETGN